MSRHSDDMSRHSDDSGLDVGEEVRLLRWALHRFLTTPFQEQEKRIAIFRALGKRQPICDRCGGPASVAFSRETMKCDLDDIQYPVGRCSVSEYGYLCGTNTHGIGHIGATGLWHVAREFAERSLPPPVVARRRPARRKGAARKGARRKAAAWATS